MYNNHPNQVEVDLADIKMYRESEKVKGSKCTPYQYARVHWTAEITDSGKLVQDTRQKFGEDKPVEFQVSKHELVRCFDLALPQMRPGEKMKIECPAKLAYGHAKNVWSDFGHNLIP